MKIRRRSFVFVWVLPLLFGCSAKKEMMVRDAIAQDFYQYLQTSSCACAEKWQRRTIDYVGEELPNNHLRLYGVFLSKDIYIGSFALWEHVKESPTWAGLPPYYTFPLSFPNQPSYLLYVSYEKHDFFGVWKRSARQVLHITEAAEAGWVSPNMFQPVEIVGSIPDNAPEEMKESRLLSAECDTPPNEEANYLDERAFL